MGGGGVKTFIKSKLTFYFQMFSAVVIGSLNSLSLN